MRDSSVKPGVLGTKHEDLQRIARPLWTRPLKYFFMPMINMRLSITPFIFVVWIFCFLKTNIAFSQDSLPIKTATIKTDSNSIIGIASYYANKFEGRKTATGETFNQRKMTCACNRLPLGTWIIVTNLKNHKTVRVRVNDRLHHRNKRLIDLTSAAAKKIGLIASGIGKVKIEIDHKKNR